MNTLTPFVTTRTFCDGIKSILHNVVAKIMTVSGVSPKDRKMPLHNAGA
jgi:hypothetical protein